MPKLDQFRQDDIMINLVYTGTNLVQFECETNNYDNHAQFSSWNQPVLSNEGKVYCSSEQQEPLFRFELTPDRHTRV